MDTARTLSSKTLGLLKFALLLTLLGALNWGLIGLFNWNLVDAVLGGGSRELTSIASRVVYALVGLAGVVAMLVLLASRREQPGEIAAGGHESHVEH